MRRRVAVPALLVLLASSASAAEEPLRPYVVSGDAIEQSLTGLPGDPARGQAVVTDRRQGLCLLCHSGPFPEAHAQGSIGPDLTDVGERLSAGQLRLRLVDMKRLNPVSVMPSYYRVEGLTRVAEAWRGKPLLTAQEIEDVVAYLVTLRN